MGMEQRSVIQRVKAHFEKGRECFSVAEWGDDDGPLEIYSFPMTLHEKRKVVDLAQGDEIESLARAVILKACDKDGNKLFTIEDKETLMRSADAGIIQNIVLWLNEGVDYSKPLDAVDDLVGNS